MKNRLKKALCGEKGMPMVEAVAIIAVCILIATLFIAFGDELKSLGKNFSENIISGDSDGF